MKYRSLWVVCIIFMLCCPSEFINAQELQPPAWSIGDWWIVKSQVYHSGEIVAGSQPGWLPPQTWRFYVEMQDSIAGQPYFVVAIRPGDDNPYPYRFRYWFRVSDRYVGRYELYHPEMSSGTKTRDIGPSVVRKNFDPQRADPFLTSKFPTVPITTPLFAVDRESMSAAAKERTIRSGTSAYTMPEFEIIQDVEDADARTLSEKANPEFLQTIGPISEEGNRVITLRTTSSLQEEQHWNPQLPWCVYGQRVENAAVFIRYWLVEIGKI